MVSSERPKFLDNESHTYTHARILMHVCVYTYVCVCVHTHTSIKKKDIKICPKTMQTQGMNSQKIK